jgi:hypothetical protein
MWRQVCQATRYAILQDARLGAIVAADAISLVQAGNRVAATLARDREWAADDAAFIALVDAGRELLPALDD